MKRADRKTASDAVLGAYGSIMPQPSAMSDDDLAMYIDLFGKMLEVAKKEQNRRLFLPPGSAPLA